ncbi:MAG: HEPN domain-containing protein [Bacteroidales bacterium]|nr:HEPN domain-containing protein [Bacteroidales bacterium]MBN2817698.1 HEPN domain-containing protein [Bacteroidales bacterium]
MTIENREDYIKYRFHRAEESFEEALILAEKGRWNSVINRLYYSCFYAVISLLLKNEIETQTHDGARTQFGLHYIKSGKIDKEFGRFFSKMFDYRQKGDYGDLYDYDEEVVKPLITETKKFIFEIEKFII